MRFALWRGASRDFLKCVSRWMSSLGSAPDERDFGDGNGLLYIEEAARIVREAEAQSRVLTVEEDARVLDLMAHVQNLEEQIGHMKRHREAGQSQKRSENQC
jgi:hypothetical protein